MRLDCALLCDAVTVRENLLHVLGGGVTRVARPQFPAPLGVGLAMRVMVHPTEAKSPHKLEARLLAEDGEEVASLEIGFQVGSSEVRPGEELSVPFALPMSQLPLPRSGAYSFELLIDGIHQASVPFLAVASPPEEPLSDEQAK